MIKILTIIRNIIFSKWKLFKPEKKKFLIFNGVSADFIYKIIKKKEAEILYVRYESINLFILFLTIWTNGFKNLKFNYKINFIKYVNPKFVINNVDNDPTFYKLKNTYSDPCYVSIQAGIRNEKEYYVLFDKILSERETLNVDHLFVFGNSIKRKIQENFKFNITVSGSVINNFAIYNKKAKNKSVLYISQSRMQEYRVYKKIAKNEIEVFNQVYKFCKTKGLELFILPRDVLEKYYRKDFIKGDWKYI